MSILDLFRAKGRHRLDYPLPDLNWGWRDPADDDRDDERSVGHGG